MYQAVSHYWPQHWALVLIPIVLYFPFLLLLSETSNTKYLINQTSPTRRKKQITSRPEFSALPWSKTSLCNHLSGKLFKYACMSFTSHAFSQQSVVHYLRRILLLLFLYILSLGFHLCQTRRPLHFHLGCTIFPASWCNPLLLLVTAILMSSFFCQNFFHFWTISSKACEERV